MLIPYAHDVKKSEDTTDHVLEYEKDKKFTENGKR